MKTTTLLVILDGFGYHKEKKHNAIAQAHTPNFDYWFTHYPHALLHASGPAVGLPEGYIGNSQVGHKTIGAGRRNEEPLTTINNAIDAQTFYNNKTLRTAFHQFASSGKTLHLMGLVSDAGVHSELKHLEAFLKAAKQAGIKDVAIHAFLDGRDTPPSSAKNYLSKLQTIIDQLKIGKICSIHGRFYAMDRDKRWDRTQQSYTLLTDNASAPFKSWQEALDHFYAQNITDEFIPPTLLCDDSTIQPGDGIVFFNFRPDRARQLAAAFVDPTFNHFPTTQLPLSFFITPTTYSDTLNTTMLYPMQQVDNTLKEVLAAHNKSIFSIAESEKYAHVTYFFNGGKEPELNNETRIIISSNRDHKTYDQYPQMGAQEITQKVLESLTKNPADFYLINYANADMVGHTGNMQATIKAIEFLDEQLGILYKQVASMNGTMYVTADHGNAEEMFNEKTRQPKTSHTTNPVPFIMLNPKLKGADATLPLTELADIAPFILKQMGLPIPASMQKI